MWATAPKFGLLQDRDEAGSPEMKGPCTGRKSSNEAICDNTGLMHHKKNCYGLRNLIGFPIGCYNSLESAYSDLINIDMLVKAHHSAHIGSQSVSAPFIKPSRTSLKASEREP
jgi:hypothetical protein